MRIIGVDPGLNVTGFGIIEVAGDGCTHVRHGVIRTRPAEPRLARLLCLRDGIRAAAIESGATLGAVEAGFVGLNARSAMTLGEARAAALLALADAGIDAAEYAPALVKQTVAGYGRGEKSQVAEMVRLQLGLKSVPTPADAADALAVAMTHWAHARLDPRNRPAIQTR